MGKGRHTPLRHWRTHQALNCHGGYTKNWSQLLLGMPSFGYNYFISVANVNNCDQEQGKFSRLGKSLAVVNRESICFSGSLWKYPRQQNYQQVNIKGIFKQSRQMGPESRHTRRITVSIVREGRKVIWKGSGGRQNWPKVWDTQQSSKVKKHWLQESFLEANLTCKFWENFSKGGGT